MNLMVKMERTLVHQWTSAGRIFAFTGACLFAAVGFAAESISITARPRYPWNGKVDLKFTIDGTSGTKYDTSFTAKDLVGNTNLTLKTLYKADGTSANAAKEQLLPGAYNWVWDATADLGEGTVLEKVVVEGKTAEKQPAITSGLVAYWPFDGDIKDHSGNSHHLSGSSPNWISDRLANSGKAASFSGSLTLSQSTDLGVTKSMTFTCWAKPESAVNFKSYDGINLGCGNFGIDNKAYPIVILPVSGSSTQAGIGFAVATDRCDVLARANSSGGLKNDPCVIMDCACDLKDGWHHIAITINNNGNPILYVDGVKKSVEATTVNGTYYLSSGSTVGGGSFASSEALGYGKTIYKGGLDELCIYDRALSATEIKQLYQAK